MNEAVELILSTLQRVRQTGEGWKALCPAHEDHTPSLHISAGDDRVLLKCHAGCSQQKVVKALGLTMADLFTHASTLPSVQQARHHRDSAPQGLTPKRSVRRHGQAHAKVVATYDYTDRQGKILYQVLRYADRTFSQRRPNGRGG